MGVRRLAVVNGPNIFQMLLVYSFVVMSPQFIFGTAPWGLASTLPVPFVLK